MIVPVACKPCQMLAWNLTAGVGLERMEVWTGRGNTIRGAVANLLRARVSKNDKRPPSPTANQVVVSHFRLHGM